ncbi:MAG: type II toxin-antitoxin system VapC family toxin [Gemmatimonadetes bacterium]|nr:type II toxin-antitoxin system VapC family toxin [Gemmatimonadota bacterium]
MLNLDTHVVLHALAGALTPAEQRLLESDSWSMSAIVLWEICKLRELGRIGIDLRAPEVTRALARIHTWP